MVHNIAMAEQFKKLETNYERLQDRICGLVLSDPQSTSLELSLNKIEDEMVADAFLNNFTVPFASGDSFESSLQQAQANMSSYDGSKIEEVYVSVEDRQRLALQKMQQVMAELKNKT